MTRERDVNKYVSKYKQINIHSFPFIPHLQLTNKAPATCLPLEECMGRRSVGESHSLFNLRGFSPKWSVRANFHKTLSLSLLVGDSLVSAGPWSMGRRVVSVSRVMVQRCACPSRMTSSPAYGYGPLSQPSAVDLLIQGARTTCVALSTPSRKWET